MNNIRKMQTAAGGPINKQAVVENQSNRNTAKGLLKGILSGNITPSIPNISRMVSSAYKGYLDPQQENPYLNTGEAPNPGMIKNPKQIIQGLQRAKKVVDATKKYITLTKESTKMQNYPKIGKRYSESKDIMSDGWPIGDILHLKIPDGTHSSLGIGNYYRAIGNRKGLKSIIENGVVAPKGQFSREGKVFWNDGYLDRTYSGRGIFALSYDKSGKAHFYFGNKPQATYVYSSNSTPIDFYDEALGIHARIPFTQTYKEIPKTQEGIDYALKLDKINRYIEKPVHKLYNWGLKPYLGYKGYKYIQEKGKTKKQY